jgi:hypothetical protein
MISIIDIDETLGAPALNIGGELAMAEVQQAGIATVAKEPEAFIPAETVAEHTADESELPSKSRPTASSRKAGPTTKKVAPKKKPGVKAVSPAKIPKHGLTVAEREELNELRMLREERNRKEREATEKLKAPEIRKIERDVISLSDDQESDAVCLPSMVRVRQASPSPSPRAPELIMKYSYVHFRVNEILLTGVNNEIFIHLWSTSSTSCGLTGVNSADILNISKISEDHYIEYISSNTSCINRS